MQDDKVKFEHRSLVGDPVMVEVPASAELGNWKKTKKIQPTVLDAEIAKQYFVSASSNQAEAYELGTAQQELYREFIANHDGKVGISFVTPPSGLVVTAPIPKKTLVLVALAAQHREGCQQSQRRILCRQISSPKARKLCRTSKSWRTSLFWLPFRFVRTTSELELVNMTFIHQQLGFLEGAQLYQYSGPGMWGALVLCQRKLD